MSIFFPRVSEDGTVGYVVYNLIVVPDAHNRIPGQLGYHKSTRGLTQVIIFIMAFVQRNFNLSFVSCVNQIVLFENK